MMRDLIHTDEGGGIHFGSDLSSAARARIKQCEKDNLKELNLKDVRMPRIPMRITDYKWVTDLKLEKNNIKTLNEKVLSHLGHIQLLDLSYNEIKELPDALNSLGALHTLNVCANALSYFNANLKFPRLHTLNVAKNTLKDFPSSFSSTLTDLDLSANQLVSVPNSVANYTRLRSLALNDNKFSTFPSQIEKLNGLETLLLNNNQLTSASITGITALTSLKVLNLAENKLDSLPPAFFQLVKLEKLWLNQNQLTSLSNDLGNFTELEELYIGRNQITAIPESITNLRKLRIISANDNKIRVLPHEIGHLYETLRKINFDNNQIQAFPGEFGWINPGIEFSFANNALKSPFSQWYLEGPLQLLDNLSPYCQAWPDTSYAEGEQLTKGVAGQGCQFTIKAFDKRGKPRVTGGDAFRVMGVGNGVEEAFIVKDNKDGSYTVFYNLQQPGEWKVFVQLRGVEVKGSPHILNLR